MASDALKVNGFTCTLLTILCTRSARGKGFSLNPLLFQGEGMLRITAYLPRDEAG